jgi:hypothetical protein
LVRRDEAPVPRDADGAEFVNAPMTEAEVVAIRLSIRRDQPLGQESRVRRTAQELGLEFGLRNRDCQPAADSSISLEIAQSSYIFDTRAATSRSGLRAAHSSPG